MKLRGAILCLTALAGYVRAQQTATAPAINSLAEVRRIYVSDLVGAGADTLRELIISSLASTKLFILTDNPERADAILKGAAEDQTFTDTLDIQEGASAHQTLGKSGSGSAASSRSNGSFGGVSLAENQSHHSRDRKHEAYATVRLCNKEGDVFWSTTQESLGAKFRGAGADVANKVARQITLDLERSRRTSIMVTGEQ